MFHWKSPQGRLDLGNTCDPPLAPPVEVTSFKDFTFGKSKSEITQSQGSTGGQALGGPVNQAQRG